MIGVACCVVSALGYALGNICMRQLTTLDCDPMWAVFNRELVTAAAVAPWLVYGAARGRPTLPGGKTLWRLVVIGLLIEVVGNVGLQWALGVVGLAVTIPVVYGVMVAAGALLGYLILGERVSLRSTAAIALLLTALVLLAVGAEAGGRSIASTETVSPGPLMLALGVLAGAAAGGSFATLSITIRHTVTRATRPTAVAFLIPLMGVVSLGPLCLWRLGFEPLWNTSWQAAALMGAAGVFNLIAFLGLVNGLQWITVVHANTLSASQVAIAAVAGVLIFHEPPNPWLVLGVCLTIVGILGFDRPAEGGGL